MIHAADISESRRLQRVVEALRAAPGGLTTRDIIERTGSCAVNSCVSEIRRNGYDILCAYEGRTADGMRVYRYRLVPPMESGQEIVG